MTSLGFYNSQSQCPQCGEMGRVPDGTYAMTGNAIRLLQGPEHTVSQLRVLAELVEAARASGASAEDIAVQLREQAGSLSGVADLLPKNRSDLYAFLTLILTIIQVFLLVSDKKQSPREININQVFEAVLEEQIPTPTPVTTATPTAQPRKPFAAVGRNDPCPCRSGKKYKKCHGKSDIKVPPERGP